MIILPLFHDIYIFYNIFNIFENLSQNLKNKFFFSNNYIDYLSSLYKKSLIEAVIYIFLKKMSFFYYCYFLFCFAKAFIGFLKIKKNSKLAVGAGKKLNKQQEIYWKLSRADYYLISCDWCSVLAIFTKHYVVTILFFNN